MKHILDASEKIPGFDRETIRSQYESVRRKYETYIREVGIQNCGFIPREKSDEIAIMTELVLEVETPNIFPPRRINIAIDKKVSTGSEDLTQPYSPVIKIQKRPLVGNRTDYPLKN